MNLTTLTNLLVKPQNRKSVIVSNEDPNQTGSDHDDRSGDMEAFIRGLGKLSSFATKKIAGLHSVVGGAAVIFACEFIIESMKKNFDTNGPPDLWLHILYGFEVTGVVIIIYSSTLEVWCRQQYLFKVENVSSQKK